MGRNLDHGGGTTGAGSTGAKYPGIDRTAAPTPAARARRALRRAVIVGGLTLVTACTTLYRDHGYMPLAEDLSLLQVGVDTRETVATTVGTPTSGGVLDGSGYYYVASRFRHVAFFEPEETEREVLAISFDDSGVMRNIERFGLQDGRVVVLSRRVTDDNIRDTTFIRQLLGSLGNFDAGTLLSGDE